MRRALKRNRDAGSGQFVTRQDAQARPKETVTETVEIRTGLDATLEELADGGAHRIRLVDPFGDVEAEVLVKGSRKLAEIIAKDLQDLHGFDVVMRHLLS